VSRNLVPETIPDTRLAPRTPGPPPVPLRAKLLDMIDPRVEWLSYRITAAGGKVSVPETVRTRYVLDGFECNLVGMDLRAVPVGDYPDPETAQAALDPALRAWESFTELTDVRLTFTFQEARVTDRGSNDLATAVTSTETGTFVEDESVVRSSHPAPAPAWFPSDNDVEVLCRRWRSVREGRALATQQGYAVLSKVEEICGGKKKDKRKNAGKSLNVDHDVLVTLGKITSAVCDQDKGRKFTGGAQRLITPDEERWLAAVVPRLILRVAERRGGVADLADLVMDDFPSLPPDLSYRNH
jgi:hypothetical protein